MPGRLNEELLGDRTPLHYHCPAISSRGADAAGSHSFRDRNMKLLVNRAALVEALGLASSVVLTRTPKPVLTCVKLVAGQTGGAKTLTLVATDMEIALQ